MRRPRLSKLLTRALAVALVVVAHGFVLNLADPPSVALGLAYGASAVLLAVAAALLWRRTLDAD